MELDEIKGLWMESNRKLEASMKLNTLLLGQWNLRKAATSLNRLKRGITFELIVNAIPVFLLGLFAADHVREPQYLIPAVVLDVYAIGILIAGARQLAQLSAIDYGEPVVAIQKKLEELRVSRIRTTLGILLFAPLMWLPILIVGLRGIFGVDVYAAATPAWLAGNLLFGLAVIALSIFIAKRYGARLGRATAMRRLADAIAGNSLTEARDTLDTIRRFEESA